MLGVVDVDWPYDEDRRGESERKEVAIKLDDEMTDGEIE